MSLRNLVLAGGQLLQGALEAEQELAVRVVELNARVRLAKWVFGPWRDLWLRSGPHRVGALADLRAARVMVAAVVAHEVSSGVLSNLQGWIAKRRMRKEAAKVRAELDDQPRCLRGQHGCAALWRIIALAVRIRRWRLARRLEERAEKGGWIVVVCCACGFPLATPFSTLSELLHCVSMSSTEYPCVLLIATSPTM